VKRILDGYDAIRTFLHEHIIPVLERLSIVLSRLRGLSIWFPHLNCTYFRSNQSEQLPLNEACIGAAIDVHRTLFLRTFEILRQLIIERTSFETFSEWLLIMGEYILAHTEDSEDRPGPALHNLKTVEIAKYISEDAERPILAKFTVDFSVDSTIMQIEGYTSYFTLIEGLMDCMKVYFKDASEELKEGVSWVIPDWIDLEIHEEITSSDMYMKHQVISTQNEILILGWEKHYFCCCCSIKISREYVPLPQETNSSPNVSIHCELF
jgi:Anaphase-promoting complex, cyclosome, subunit 4